MEMTNKKCHFCGKPDHRRLCDDCCLKLDNEEIKRKSGRKETTICKICGRKSVILITEEERSTIKLYIENIIEDKRPEVDINKIQSGYVCVLANYHTKN